MSRLGFHPGSDQRRFRLEQWHSLTLHVGAHQCAVGIVVFEEWNQRSRDGHNLFWRHVHEVDFFAVDGREVTVFADTAGDLFVDETVVFVQRFVGLGDRVFPFFVGGQVDDFVSGHAIDDAAVRRFNKAVFVDAGVNRQRPDQPDVRTFRGFNWAHSPVVGVVNVSHFKSGTFSGQTARPQCRQTALVGQFRKRVVLVHELRQLRGTEEFLERRVDRAGVDEALRRQDFIILHAHAFAHHSFHSGQADSKLVLEQFPDRAQTTVAQVVDIVGFADAVFQTHKIGNGRVQIRVEQVLRHQFTVTTLDFVVFFFVGKAFIVHDFVEHRFVDEFLDAEVRHVERQILFGQIDEVVADDVERRFFTVNGDGHADGVDAGVLDGPGCRLIEFLALFDQNFAGFFVNDVVKSDLTD